MDLSKEDFQKEIEASQKTISELTEIKKNAEIGLKVNIMVRDMLEEKWKLM